MELEERIRQIVMIGIERLEAYLREELRGVLDNLEPFRDVREDAAPLVRRRPGRPRKIHSEGEPPAKRLGRRPTGRKKMIREAIALRELRKRLDGGGRAPKGTPPRTPVVRPPQEREDVDTFNVPRPTSPEPDFERDTPPSFIPPPPLDLTPREIAPPARVDWDTFPEKFGGYETRSGTEEARMTLQLYEDDRPKTRADCMTARELAFDEDWVRANPGKTPVDGKNSSRPCPWVSCRHHLAVNITTIGSLQVIRDWDDGRPTCALDVVEANGPAILDTTGKFFGVTRERLRQIEVKAFERVREASIEWEDPPERRDNEAA